jgi:hypothetical protein
MGIVGGDPALMTGGAARLHRDGADVQQMQPAVASAAGSASAAAGDPALSGSIDRFGAAWSTMLGDTGLQLVVAAQLAAAAAADLSTAGGGH